MATNGADGITWGGAEFNWNDSSYTWDDVQLILRAAGEDWNTWEKDEKKKLVKLILKVHGKTITESKQKEIKQYKITAKDIKIAVKEVLGAEMIAENVAI
tara:strand:- start:154 stop:453 length:300 start_codon:yes stop_codon:yes gene_type:complete